MASPTIQAMRVENQPKVSSVLRSAGNGTSARRSQWQGGYHASCHASLQYLNAALSASPYAVTATREPKSSNCCRTAMRCQSLPSDPMSHRLPCTFRAGTGAKNLVQRQATQSRQIPCNAGALTRAICASIMTAAASASHAEQRGVSLCLNQRNLNPFNL